MYFSRNEKAVEETDKKYGKYLSKVAYNILENSEDSKECINDTYLNTWNSVPPKRPSIFKIFLAKITRNIAINRYNKENTLKRGKNVIKVCTELEECIDSDYLEGKLDYSRLVERINNFLDKLSIEKRVIFIERYFYLENVKNIAKKHNLSESNVKVSLMRIRKDLKKYLKEGGYYG
ncbi:MAG: sigma-70 family RNA polymerase sigma factor [Clostridia bacterium]|nr:sigma-70 family RNA polymerase sigma factor [Clostridia bacterium]